MNGSLALIEVMDLSAIFAVSSTSILECIASIRICFTYSVVAVWVYVDMPACGTSTILVVVNPDGAIAVQADAFAVLLTSLIKFSDVRIVAIYPALYLSVY